MAGSNALQGSASQESFSGKGTVSGGQSVDLQSQTYDATCKTVAENAWTCISFDAGFDHLPSNSPLTIHTSQKSQQNLLPLSWLATLQPYEDNQEFAVANNKRKKQSPAEKTNKQTKIKRLLLINCSSQENHHFTKYYSGKFPRLDLDTKLNVKATDKDLKTKIGKPAMEWNHLIQKRRTQSKTESFPFLTLRRGSVLHCICQWSYHALSASNGVVILDARRQLRHTVRSVTYFSVWIQLATVLEIFTSIKFEKKYKLCFLRGKKCWIVVLMKGICIKTPEYVLIWL